jgi:hypothetical protein
LIVDINNQNNFTQDKLVGLLKDLNVKYPHIVLAQARLETGGYKSRIFKENNNLFGMRQATVRINTASGCLSFVGNGYCNIASGLRSSILGGQFNTTNTCADAMIVGSCITADRVCTTFVNNLSIMNIPTSGVGLPVGSVYRVGNALCIVI